MFTIITLLTLFSSVVFAQLGPYLAPRFHVPDGVCDLNIAAYTGGWFELASAARVAKTIERGCECPVAYYSLNATNPEIVDVTNSCIRYGMFWKLQGNAYPVSGKPSGNLNVKFNSSTARPLSGGNYVVLKTWADEFNDYTNAVVGGSNANTWWVLGRSPSDTEGIMTEAFSYLENYGYNTTGHVTPVQDCIFLGGHEGINLQKT